ncbi:MAG: hypothetical protein IJN80_04585 [Clostridia bacterium]|nr:hypothetical protein [Clostridia bacterium]
MLTNLFNSDLSQAPPKEGTLYKSVTIEGITFDLYYGYYEEFERHSRFNEPIPIYPDFLKSPRFTKDGLPFVTAMQDICEGYQGPSSGDSCADCVHFRKQEELFGLCSCPKRQKLL